VKLEPKRWLAHAAATPRALRRAFPAAVLDAIGAAVGAAEAGHGGEIRVVIEAVLPWAYLRRNASARQRALDLFASLRVWDTEHNNGVMIYVGLADRAVEIVADRGIAALVAAAAWQSICEALRQDFAAGRYQDGAVAAVRAVGMLLQKNAPLAAGTSRVNEISDRPVVL
jgi:uncharacterized membrane protein